MPTVPYSPHPTTPPAHGSADTLESYVRERSWHSVKEVTILFSRSRHYGSYQSKSHDPGEPENTRTGGCVWDPEGTALQSTGGV